MTIIQSLKLSKVYFNPPSSFRYGLISSHEIITKENFIPKSNSIVIFEVNRSLKVSSSRGCRLE